MTQIKEHIKLLGFEVKDRVTGYKGVVTHIGFDLYGCVQAIVQPKANAKNELVGNNWFDISRLEAVSAKPVLTVPDFENLPKAITEGRKGPAEKALK